MVSVNLFMPLHETTGLHPGEDNGICSGMWMGRHESESESIYEHSVLFKRLKSLREIFNKTRMVVFLQCKGTITNKIVPI